MAVEAPLSKFKKNGFKIYIAILVGLASWFIYDGYLNKGFIEKNTLDYGTEDARPNGTLVFNQKAPPFLLAGAAALTVYFFMIKDRKLTTDDTALAINGKKTIAYDKIESIDKTHFDTKGYFVITHIAEGGKETNLKLSDRMYDNLSAVLDELVAQIS
ncbi:MAG: hypothetical protein J7M40_01175 [Planctomycetes bacterium]|nr:hypothetical protein [Planctomycetota bacterium]